MSSSRERARRFVRGRAWHHARRRARRRPGACRGGLAGVLLPGALALAPPRRRCACPRSGCSWQPPCVGGFAVGRERLDAIDRPGLSLRPGAEVRGRATLLTAPRTSRFGWSAELELARREARGCLRARPAELARPRRAGRRRAGGDGQDRRGQAPRASSTGPPTCGGAGSLRELALYSARATGGRRGGASGFVDGLRRRAERAVDARPSARSGRARPRDGPRPGRAHRPAGARRLPGLGSRPPAGGQRAERDAARGARAAAARPRRLPGLGFAPWSCSASSRCTSRWPARGRRSSGRESWAPPAFWPSPPRALRPARTRSCSRRP